MAKKRIQKKQENRKKKDTDFGQQTTTLETSEISVQKTTSKALPETQEYDVPDVNVKKPKTVAVEPVNTQLAVIPQPKRKLKPLVPNRLWATIFAGVLLICSFFDIPAVVPKFAMPVLLNIVMLVILIANLYIWNRGTLLFAAATTLVLGGFIVGKHVYISMIKGIPIFSGVQEGTILGIPEQIGLINLPHAFWAIIVLVYTVFLVSYFLVKRQRQTALKIEKKEQAEFENVTSHS